MTTNDVVYKLAERAKVLADSPYRALRRTAPNTADLPSQAEKENKHLTRGQLVEIILTEEFCEEFPKEIAED